MKIPRLINKTFVIFYVLVNIAYVDAENLEFKYGVGYNERISGIITPERVMLKELLTKVFNLSPKDEKVEIKNHRVPSFPFLKIYSYNELSDGRYFVYALISDSEETLQKSNINPLDDDLNYFGQFGGSAVLLIVNPEEETVKILKHKERVIFPNIQIFGGGRYSTGSASVYACLQAYPTTISDVNMDGVEDLVFFGGEGALYFPEDSVSAKTYLYFFLGPDYSQAIRKVYFHEEEFNFYFQSNIYSVTRDTIGSQLEGEEYEGKFVMGNGNNLRPGYRVFSKMYVGDFEKEGVNALLVWRRSYISSKKNEKPGFEFSDEEFELFSFSEHSMNSRKLKASVGKMFLKENRQTWKTGYPSSTLCSSRGAGDQIILDYGYDELKILDSIIEE